MISCPTCTIGFNPKSRDCPKCHSDHPNLESRLETLPRAAEGALDDGAEPRSVAALWVEDDVSAQQARDVISVGAKKVPGAARHRGLLRVLGGLAIGLLGSAILLLVGQTMGGWRADLLFPGAARAVLDEGREDQARRVIRQLARRTLGEPDEPTVTRLEGITDMERLERIIQRVGEALNWQDLLDTP